jgi:hypothetical protein
MIALKLLRPVSIALVLSGAVGALPVQAQHAGLQSDGRLVVTAAANSEVQRYVEQVSGRYGALAVSQDGTKAVSYICRSHLWKNCDEPGNDDSNIAIPSGKIARDEALTRCRSESGSACILIFINDDQQRDFQVQP